MLDIWQDNKIKPYFWEKLDAYDLSGFDTDQINKGRFIVLKQINGVAAMSEMICDEDATTSRQRFNTLLAFPEILGIDLTSELIAALANGLCDYEKRKMMEPDINVLLEIFGVIYTQSQQKGADK